MNVRNILALEEVKNDLDRGSLFYEAQAPGVGDYFRTAIIADMESLRLYAGIHPRRMGYYRMLSKRFPYAIYYDVEGQTAVVVAVLDLRRDPARVRQELVRRHNELRRSE